MRVVGIGMGAGMESRIGVLQSFGRSDSHSHFRGERAQLELRGLQYSCGARLIQAVEEREKTDNVCNNLVHIGIWNMNEMKLIESIRSEGNSTTLILLESL